MQTDSQATNQTGRDIRKQPITNAPNYIVRQKGERDREAHRSAERHATIQTVGQTSKQTNRQPDTLATTPTDTNKQGGRYTDTDKQTHMRIGGQIHVGTNNTRCGMHVK